MVNTALEQLTPQNSVLLFIDHQPQMAFGVANIDRHLLKNEVVREHCGAYGIGVDYAYTRVHGAPQRGEWKGSIRK